MRSLTRAGAAVLLFGLVGSARAEDPVSLFVVRDAGHGTVGLSYSAQEETQTDNLLVGGPFPLFASDKYRFEYQTATLSGSVGIGYGFELFIDGPDVIEHQTSRNGFETHLPTGFGDADFGFKYRIFGASDSPDRMVLRATFTHHSSSVGSDELALYYAHSFLPDFSIGLQSFYDYEEIAGSVGTHYRADQYGGTGLVFWNAAPNFWVIPLIRLYNTEAYETVPSAVTTELGLQLGYYWSRSWSLTPTLAYLHTDSGHFVVNSIYSINYGVRSGVLGSLLLQYQF